MAQIRVLPLEVAHKIAAGEVIERPASVVKELVENSLDASATQVDLEIRGGGLELIRVQDNGTGIARAELELAFQPHATSKIASADDLFALATLGFRGEALPSMASVAKLTMYSRPAEQEHGFLIRPERGEFVIEPVGTPVGTAVEVRELFYNVPARLKFLKSVSAERRQVVDLVTKLALAHPHLAIRLHLEQKMVLSTPGNGRLLDTILVVQGANIERELSRFQASFAWGNILGYLGSPRLAKGNRSAQVFVLNGRVINSPTMRAALEKAYADLLPSRTFPWAILIVDLRPELVDCNVHPAKAEVRFAQEQVLFSDLLQAIRSGLLKKELAPRLEKSAPPKAKDVTRRAVQAQLSWQPESWEQMDRVLRQYRPTRAAQLQSAAVREERPAIAPSQPSQVFDDLEEVRQLLRTGRIIGQLLQSYILLEAPSGLWILDQHIVHERVLLEELQAAWESRTIHVQEILPQQLDYSPAEMLLVREALGELAELGLELEEFGPTSFLLRAVPSTIAESGGTWREEVLEIAARTSKTTTAKEQALITLACKGAVKAGEYLDERVSRALLVALSKTKNPFTCPHGRPIIVRLEQAELLRRFGRT